MSFELILILAIILLFPFGQLTRIPVSSASVGLYFQDIFVSLLIGFWLFKKIKQGHKPLFLKGLTQPILAFAVNAGFSLLLALPFFKPGELLISFFYYLRWIGLSMLIFIVSDIKDREKILISDFLIIASAFSAILGILQYVYIPDLRPLTAFGWDPHYFRIVGTYLDAGYSGLLYLLGLILVWDKLINGNLKLKRQELIIYSIFFILLSAVLALTYSRSSYLGYILAAGFLSYKRKKLFTFLVISILAGLFLLSVPKRAGEGVRLNRENSTYARFNNWKQSFLIAFKKPLFGWGFNTYRYTQRKMGLLSADNWLETHAGSGADSSLLFIFATTGIIGLISYLWLLIRMVKIGFLKNNLILISTVIAILVHSLFNNSLFFPWAVIWLGIILGMA